MNIERYPLTWPTGQPRTPSHARREAQFQVEFGRARDDLLSELRLLGAKDIVLSTSVPLRRDGIPYANMPEPNDPGVAVYFNRSKWSAGKTILTPFVVACDTYRKVRWNTRAVGATVEALRSIQRHGATSMLEQAFTGFAALPPSHTPKSWWEVLGITEDATDEQIVAAHRELVLIHHPDRGGDSTRMAEINAARDEALQS